jgi:predicted phage terminase large subunit-like protein
MTSAFALAIEALEPTKRAPATPSEFALRCSRGRWTPAPHLAVIEDECLAAIDEQRGVTISASVRHGKSVYVSQWLIAWFLGTHPDKRVILATHEATFARKWGREVRNLLDEHGPDVFGIKPASDNRAANEWGIEGHAGGMLTVGVGGTPIGRGADLLIVDDPLKSWEAAMSALSRQKVIDWWTGTMESRREPGSATIVICARWHEDDLTGFLLAENPDEWRDVRLPALCDDPANDPLGRAEGEALWSERYDVDELAKRRRAVSLSLGDQVWDAQYQQRPSTPEGGMFTADWPTETRAFVEARSTGRWVRRWDLAATQGGGDWTVGVLATTLTDGRVAIVDVTAGQWAPDAVRDQLVGCAASDPAGTQVVLPQDPGQAGKDQAQQLIRLLAPHDAVAMPETGSKEVRAVGLAAQQRAGNVALVEATWNRAFVAELSGFPRARHDDQVDAAAGAFNALHSSGGEATVTRYSKRAGR